MDKNNLFLKFLVICIFTLPSCVTTKINSDKNPEFNQKISKLFNSTRGLDDSEDHLKSLVSSLVKELKINGIETSRHYMNPLSLDNENTVRQKINDYSPQAIMSIQQTGQRYNTMDLYGNTTETGIMLDIQIFLPGNENPVWRASFLSDGVFGVGTTIKRSTKTIIEKMKLDGIIN